MAARVSVAVMHCTKKQNQKVIERGNKVAQTMYNNPLDYPDPPVLQAALCDKLSMSETAQSLVKNGGIQQRASRDTEVKELYEMLDMRLRVYANGLYKGDQAKLLRSGFDVSNDPVPHDVPMRPVIRRADKGPEPRSAKVLITKPAGTLSTRRINLIYTLWINDGDIHDGKFRNILAVTNMHKLIATGLERGKEYAFAVSCGNVAGTSELSAPAFYIAT